MKKLNYFNPLFCLSLFLSLGMFSISGLNAEVIEAFPETDFWVVDHTTPQYAPNLTGIIGYQYKPMNMDNAYQLTDTVPYMTVALWNKNKLDLNQSWEFDMRLFFDTGQKQRNQSNSIGSKNRSVSDGMAFVLHKFDTLATRNMIGNGAWYLGYGGLYTPQSAPVQDLNNQQTCNNLKNNVMFQANTLISPSFAIEFDTECNGLSLEGGSVEWHHISYLKNGSMTALPGTHKPMQNNWANVGIGDWFDVKIVWRKGYNENNTPYYDLLTYVEEKDSLDLQYGMLLLRDSLRFNSLGEVIEGLEVDSNCQALVTWGVTSATCFYANRQIVEFVKLETISPAITAGIVGSCDGIPPSAVLSFWHQDTILRPSDIIDCYSSESKLQADDTVEYSISCTDVTKGYQCNYWLSLSDIPEGADIKYYLNDVLVTDSSFYATNSVWNNLYFLSLQYPFDGNNNTVSNAKITINGAEYNFRFTVEDADCAEGCDAVTIAPPPSQPREGTGNSRFQSTLEDNPTIQLGERDIHYVVKTTSNSGSSITTAFINEIPSPKLMQNSSVTRLDDTSYSVTAKFNGREWSDDSTTFEICATLSNGTTCCDTFQIFVGPTELVAPDYYLHTFHSQLRGAIDYKILDTNATLVTTVPPLELNVEVYDDFGNSLRTLHNEVPVSPEGTIYYGDLPMPLNNIVFQWGDKIVTVRVVKISK